MKFLKVLSLVVVLTFVYSCANNNNDLIGTWKAIDVKTEFDENSMTPAMISQVVEMQKETYFRILNDSTLIIVTSDNTYEGKWNFDEDDNTIKYFFEGMETTSNKLGELVEKNIVSKTTTPLGTIIITYGKEK